MKDDGKSTINAQLLLFSLWLDVNIKQLIKAMQIC